MEVMTTIRLLLFAIVALIPITASADEIVFKLRNLTGDPLEGEVKMLVGESNWRVVVPIAPSGEGKLTNVKCKNPPDIFTANAFEPGYFLERREQHKRCAIGEIVFTFRETVFVAAFRDLLKSDAALVKTASKVAQDLHSDMLAAYRNGEIATASQKSLLLRDQIEKEFGKEAATKFNMLSLSLAASRVGNTEPLVFDKKQDAVVLSGELAQSFKQFQKSKGIEVTGNVDWKTAGKLPAFEKLPAAYTAVRQMPTF
jgi:hypothetical protein